MPRQTQRRGGARGKAPVRPPAPENPWDRQPNETAPAWQAFRCYLELRYERSLRAVAGKLHKSMALIGRWSRENQWVARVDAFEAAAAKAGDDAAFAEHEKRSREHALAAELIIDTLLEPGREILERIREAAAAGADDRPLKDLPLEDLLRINATSARVIPRAVQMERLARGLSTSNVGGHDGGPLTPAQKARAEADQRVGDMNDERLDDFLLGAAAERKRITEAERKGEREPAA